MVVKNNSSSYWSSSKVDKSAYPWQELKVSVIFDPHDGKRTFGSVFLVKMMPMTKEKKVL